MAARGHSRRSAQGPGRATEASLSNQLLFRTGADPSQPAEAAASWVPVPLRQGHRPPPRAVTPEVKVRALPAQCSPGPMVLIAQSLKVSPKIEARLFQIPSS